MKTSCCCRSFTIPVLPLHGRVKECTSAMQKLQYVCILFCQNLQLFSLMSKASTTIDIFISVHLHFIVAMPFLFHKCQWCRHELVVKMFKHCFICNNLFPKCPSKVQTGLTDPAETVSSDNPAIIWGQTSAKRHNSIMCFDCEIKHVDCLSCFRASRSSDGWWGVTKHHGIYTRGKISEDSPAVTQWCEVDIFKRPLWPFC